MPLSSQDPSPAGRLLAELAEAQRLDSELAKPLAAHFPGLHPLLITVTVS